MSFHHSKPSIATSCIRYGGRSGVDPGGFCGGWFGRRGRLTSGTGQENPNETAAEKLFHAFTYTPNLLIIDPRYLLYYL
jgi:hypothetical protein